MNKPSFYASSWVFAGVVAVAVLGIFWSGATAAGPAPAPADARYVVTHHNATLSAEVLTTQFEGDLIASASDSKLGSNSRPWDKIFGNTGKFGTVTTTDISAGGTNQDIALNPSGTGTVNIGGNSLVFDSSASDPVTGHSGQIYFNTVLHEFRGFDGTSWRSLAYKPSPTPTPTPTPTPVPGSVVFDRDLSQYLSVSNADQSELNVSSAFSIEAWVKIAVLPSSVSDAYTIVNKGDRGVNAGYSFQLSGTDNLIVYYSNATTGNRACIADSATLTSGDLNTWVHLAATVNVTGDVFALYKNGVAVPCTLLGTAGSSVTSSPLGFTIGIAEGPEGTFAQFFDGKIDDVRVWNTVRTSTEIASDFNSEGPQ